MRLDHITPKGVKAELIVLLSMKLILCVYVCWFIFVDKLRISFESILQLSKLLVRHHLYADLPGGNSEREPPDTIPTSEVKPFSANDSVGSPM